MNVPHFVERGAGECALVFLHGIGGGAAAWTTQLDAFATLGYRAIAWDMPGYGSSAMIEPYTMAAAADALAALITRVASPTTVVVGHSLGGMVAQEFAGAHPGRCQGLVLFATSPAFGKSDGNWQQEFLAARLKPLDEGRTMAEVAANLVPTMLGDAIAPGCADQARALMAAVPPATYRAAMRTLVGFDRRAWLGDIEVPTLVLSGERDGNAPPSVMRRMAEKITGAHYVELPGAGHLGNMEQPDAFNAALRTFLAQHFPTPANPRPAFPPHPRP